MVKDAVVAREGSSRGRHCRYGVLLPQRGGGLAHVNRMARVLRCTRRLESAASPSSPYPPYCCCNG